MEKLNETFHGLFSKFQENPFTFTLFVILCLFSYVIYTQVDTLEQYIPTPEYESAQFEASLTRDEQINASLEDSRVFYDAAGVTIGQFHNGQYDLTRLPFTKVSITYYTGDLSQEQTINLYNARPISTMNNIMLDMWKDKEKPQCIAKATSQLRDIGYKNRMESIGIGFVTLCPLTNIRNYPIGYLSVGYRESDPDPEKIDILLDYQRTLSARIAGYLQEGAIRENSN